MNKIILTVLFIILATASAYFSLQTPDIITPTMMLRCDKTSHIVVNKLSDTKNNPHTLYWSDAASKECPGPGFPRIIVEHPKVKYWVQVIKANIPYEYLNGHTE